jgi:hypothetical protein
MLLLLLEDPELCSASVEGIVGGIQVVENPLHGGYFLG